VLREAAGGAVTAIPISFDQKPENPAEKARIKAAGGRVEPLPGPPGEDCGPQRVWLADVDVPGLAMSRSIGDEVSQQVGVISVPEIIVHDLVPEDRLVVWASDGVWEFISNEEAAEIIWKNKGDLKRAALCLVDEATNRWKEEEEVIDDITCVILEFLR
jgi:serine/threonine protein phosphatase PrpC